MQKSPGCTTKNLSRHPPPKLCPPPQITDRGTPTEAPIGGHFFYRISRFVVTAFLLNQASSILLWSDNNYGETTYINISGVTETRSKLYSPDTPEGLTTTRLTRNITLDKRFTDRQLSSTLQFQTRVYLSAIN